MNNFTLETNQNVTMLQQTVDRMMSDMKEHFETATNTVAAHNSAMLQEVRVAYQEEPGPFRSSLLHDFYMALDGGIWYIWSRPPAGCPPHSMVQVGV